MICKLKESLLQVCSCADAHRNYLCANRAKREKTTSGTKRESQVEEEEGKKKRGDDRVINEQDQSTYHCVPVNPYQAASSK